MATLYQPVASYRQLSLAIITALILSACASAPQRTAPLPKEFADKSTILGQTDFRQWADETPEEMHWWATASDEEILQRYAGIAGRKHHYLALSGGGENGAFCAGLLAGWTAAGNRPEFTMVTGISTGALIAPFAFLGAKYDVEVKDVYTNHAMEDLIEERGVFKILRNDAVANSTPMQELIARNMTADVMTEIATEYRRGRRLYIGTTNLDAARPVIWNIGRIADSGEPGSLELIRKVMLASASIPVGIPPVIFDVNANGESYQEMHVDGGVTEQVFLYPPGMDFTKVERRLNLQSKPRVYVIRNAYLDPDWVEVERKIAPIAGRTISSLIRSQGIGDLYRMYLITQRDGVEYNLAYIPGNFRGPKDTGSGVEYMKRLYYYAYTMALGGYPWEHSPPGLYTETDTQ